MRDASQSTQQPSTTRIIDQTSTYDYESDEEVLSVVTAYLDSMLEPKTLNSANSRLDWTEWEQAVQDKLDSLKENQVWNVVDRPKGRKVVDSKWVFKIKHNADGSIDRYKARLVAKGFTQIQGLDFDETFSPVIRYDTLRLLLALSAHFQWTSRQLDIKTAFLYGLLKEDIYMELPEGSRTPGKVAKLNWCIYGLKQSSREWYYRLVLFLQP